MSMLPMLYQYQYFVITDGNSKEINLANTIASKAANAINGNASNA